MIYAILGVLQNRGRKRKEIKSFPLIRYSKVNSTLAACYAKVRLTARLICEHLGQLSVSTNQPNQA